MVLLKIHAATLSVLLFLLFSQGPVLVHAGSNGSKDAAHSNPAPASVTPPEEHRPARADPRRYLDSVSPMHFNPGLFDEYHKLPPNVRARLDRHIGKQDLQQDPMLRVQLHRLSHGNGPGIEQALGRARMQTAHATALDLERRQKQQIAAAIQPDGARELPWAHPGLPRPGETISSAALAHRWVAEKSVPELVRFVRDRYDWLRGRPKVEVVASRKLWEAMSSTLRGLMREEWEERNLDSHRHIGNLEEAASPRLDFQREASVHVLNRWLRHNWGSLPEQERRRFRHEAERKGEEVQWDTPLGVPRYPPYDEKVAKSIRDRYYKSVRERYYSTPSPR